MNKRLAVLLVGVVLLGGVLLYTRSRPKKTENAKRSAPPVRLTADPKVRPILEAADQACRTLTTATLEATYQGEGAFSVTAPSVQGTISFDAAQDWIRISGMARGRDETERKLEQATDGEQVVTLDFERKTFVFGEYPAARPLLGPGIKLLMGEFGHETPFRDELESGSKLEGTREVDGVLCDVVYVEYSDAQASRWFIAQSDHLPRRVERIYNNYVGNKDRDKTVLTISRLTTGPTFAKADFQIAKPDDFEEFELPTPAPPLAVGTPAPPWELKGPEGTPVRLADLRGSVVVLDFWATWCGPCKIAMPKLQEMHVEFQDRPVKILGINCQEDEGGDPEGYMKSQDYTYGLLLDGDDVARAYSVFALPTLYVIDTEGRVVFSVAGAGAEEELRKAVLEALEKSET